MRFSQGSALQFDGKDDYVDAGNGASLNVTNAVTLEAWIYKKSSNNTDETIAGKGWELSYNSGYRLLYNSSLDKLTFFFWNDTATVYSTSPKANIELNRWYHIVETFDGSTIKHYINGTLFYARNVGTTTIVNSASTFRIGQSSNGQYPFNGSIDEVRVYNQALSAEEISRQYTHSKYVSPASTWSVPVIEEQYALGVLSQNPTIISLTGATLNGELIGFGGETSITAYFKYGSVADNLDQTSATQVMNDNGFFSKAVTGLAVDTTYYFQAVVSSSASTAYGPILSFQTAAFDTDYYRTIINSDGSLTLTNKDTGETILNSSPRYNLNYGDTSHNIVTPPVNNSFETDANVDNIPDGWIVDKSYIRLSTEQASNGTKSLKFNMASTDTDHRRVYSSLLPVALDKHYTIALDTYADVTLTGSGAIFVAYYDTPDGTGTQYISSVSTSISASAGSWHNFSLDWAPPASA